MTTEVNVLVVPDEGFWYCQGIEFDYGAQGDTYEEAMKNFHDALVATIKLIKERNGQELSPTAPEILAELGAYPGVRRGGGMIDLP